MTRNVNYASRGLVHVSKKYAVQSQRLYSSAHYKWVNRNDILSWVSQQGSVHSGCLGQHTGLPNQCFHLTNVIHEIPFRLEKVLKHENMPIALKELWFQGHLRLNNRL